MFFMFCRDFPSLVLYTHWCFKGRPDAPETHTLLFPHAESQAGPAAGFRLGLAATFGLWRPPEQGKLFRAPATGAFVRDRHAALCAA